MKDINRNLAGSDKALSGSQIMRGPYVNTGSKDVGPDPDWDVKKGTYKGQSIGYGRRAVDP